MEIAEQRTGLAIGLSARLDGIVARPFPLFLAIFVVFIVAFGASILLIPRRYGRLIIGDGIYYYVYLRSVVLDHDLDFTNDYTLYQQYNNEDPGKKREMLELHKTPFGQPANYFSVGPALLWLPVFLVTHAAAVALGLRADGFSYFYEAPILLSSILYGFIGILLTYRVVAGIFSRWAAFLSLLGVWLATNVVYYMGVSPSASHVLSLFAVALFLFLWWRRSADALPSAVVRGSSSPRRVAVRADKAWGFWFIWGLSTGLMTLVRWQDILIAALALFQWCADWRRLYMRLAMESYAPADVRSPSPSDYAPEHIADPRPPPAPVSFDRERGGVATALNRILTTTRIALPNGLSFALGLLIAFLPQMLAWQILYGAPFTAPQGANFFSPLHPELLNVWFSTKRGLFSWTPLLALGVVGFIPLYRRNRLLGASAIVIFLTESYVNSIVYDWWGGEAFGARRFVSLIPFFALGLAALCDAVAARFSRRALLFALGAFTLWNLLFILQYDLWLHGIGHISAQPTLAEITIDKFTTPFQLLSRLK